MSFPQNFMKPNSAVPMSQPGMDKTGPVPVKPAQESMPVEQLIQQQKQGQAAPQPTVPQYIMMPSGPPPPQANPGQMSAPAAAAAPAPPAGAK